MGACCGDKQETMGRLGRADCKGDMGQVISAAPGGGHGPRLHPVTLTFSRVSVRPGSGCASVWPQPPQRGAPRP